MTTLFQLHANIDALKLTTNEMGLLWHAGDSILLMGETGAYIDWLDAYIKDLNSDDETEVNITNISNVFILEEDIKALNDSAQINLNFNSTDALNIKIINDIQWVELTNEVDRVITLT